MTETTTAQVFVHELQPGQEPPPGTMTNAHGYYVPIDKIRPQHLMEDQVVKRLVEQAKEKQSLLSAFRDAAFSDVDAFNMLLAERYGARPRSAGNMMLSSYDGLMKVEVSTGQFITLGPELQVAKTLIDECLDEWSRDGDQNLRAIVQDAFAMGEGGRLRVDRILELKRVEIAEPKWRRAMEAIGEAVRVTRSKRYVRFHTRENAQAKWRQITLDLASVP